MRFQEFKTKLNDFIVFSLVDIKKIDPNFHNARLVEWQEKGYLKKIVKGYYIFSDQDLGLQTLYTIANKIFDPSYVSLESALSFYRLIPETVYGISSVSSRNTYSFNVEIGNFIYKKIKANLLFGYKLEKYKNQVFKIAEIEKAILDYLYLNPSLKDKDDFDEWRIDIDELKDQWDQNKFEEYSLRFDNKALLRRSKKFLEYINA